MLQKISIYGRKHQDDDYIPDVRECPLCGEERCDISVSEVTDSVSYRCKIACYSCDCRYDEYDNYRWTGKHDENHLYAFQVRLAVRTVEHWNKRNGTKHEQLSSVPESP